MTVLDRFRLDGRRALVTGGSRGLGRVMAQALAEAGADLVLVGRTVESLRQAEDELRATGRAVRTLVGDMGEPADVERVCDEVLERYGPIDILLNNVGGRRIATPTSELSLDDWRRFIDLNLTSAFLCCRKIGTPMLARKRGSIIVVTSIAAQIVSRGIGGRVYETAKAGLEHFVRSLAADWAPHNVRVNALAPGVFLTEPNKKWFAERPELQRSYGDLIPMGRFGNPEEIGPTAVWLASDASSYVTGSTVVVDGGYLLW